MISSPTSQSISQYTIHPSQRHQTFVNLLRSLSSSLNTSGAKKFLEDLALRSRNRYQSDRRVFRDLPDGFAFLLLVILILVWFTLSASASWSIFHDPKSAEIITSISQVLSLLIWQGPLALLLSMTISFISSLILYQWTVPFIHITSLTVLSFTLFNGLSSLPFGKFGSGNCAALLTFLFLGIFYVRGVKHIPLTAHFIKSASRICWRNRVYLSFVFTVYAVLLIALILFWSTSILFLQQTAWLKYFRISSLVVATFVFVLFGSFLRDLLQIWLSRIIYMTTFAYSARPVTVTSVARRPSNIVPDSLDDLEDRHDPVDDPFSVLEETQRQVSRESLWWCTGTAARSSFHLTLRAFQVHIWLLTLLQVFVKWGPPVDPRCVLDVFHVPTAIYGTSYSKSRRFVGETMVDHGLDKISVDIYLRTFIYYMLSYACGIITLLLIWSLLGSQFTFHPNFLTASAASLLTASLPVHFIFFYVFCGTVLFMTAIDSVHMILCWAICETPTSVSALEPKLMHVLVSSYHARLDLKRFTGDRIFSSEN